MRFTEGSQVDMGAEVTVLLPEYLQKRVEYFARFHEIGIEGAVTILLERGLSVSELEETTIDWPEEDLPVQREGSAYLALYPKLKKQYLGKCVAIYQGELIDYDNDYEALYFRTHTQYPDQYVLLAQVGSEPIETIVVRSPRIMRD